ncbi:MAG: GNAT family N-acetyltransferase [Verrucomicrobiaceae bacterium]|nr:GNAT family N-acetyltransferase [Verrucomicrobiaceae bacterium]
MSIQLSLPQSSGRIRQHRDSDLEPMIRHAANPKVPRFLMDVFPKPYTREHGEEWLRRCKKASEVEALAIEVNRQYVGEITCRRKDDVHRLVGIIGYWLAEPYWGQGIMTEAVRVFTDHLLSEADLVRVEACVYEPNKASARVLEKAGFMLEGIRRKSVIKNGVILDDLIYSKVRD